MKTVFADTVYYFALLNKADEWHPRAIAFTKTFSGSILTTEWVLTEVADGLAAPATRMMASRLLDFLRQDTTVSIISFSRVLFDRGLELYSNRPDKSWSLTDCISFIVMQDAGITDVLTGDHHFEQAGFRTILQS